jgi:hypothetical protein
MSSFTSPLIVTPMPDGRKWKLVKSFSYHIGTKFSRDYIRVPKGFVTDFASVPWVLWSWIPSWGKYGKAAVIHDHIYQTHCRTRKQADEIFREAMIVSGTPEWKANLMFWGVRLFGWLAWH